MNSLSNRYKIFDLVQNPEEKSPVQPESSVNTDLQEVEE
jgi:hypothetical protein